MMVGKSQDPAEPNKGAPAPEDGTNPPEKSNEAPAEGADDAPGEQPGSPKG